MTNIFCKDYKMYEKFETYMKLSMFSLTWENKNSLTDKIIIKTDRKPFFNDDF